MLRTYTIEIHGVWKKPSRSASYDGGLGISPT